MNKFSSKQLFMYVIMIVFFVGVTYGLFFNPKTRLINKPIVTDSTEVIIDTTNVVVDSLQKN